MDYSNGDEGMDDVFPIRVDVTRQKTKHEDRRLSLPVSNDTKTFRVRGFTCRKTQPIKQTSNSTPKHSAMGQGLPEDLELLNPTWQMYSDRRSTSMPEFYGLTEFRAKHDMKEASKNMRRTKTGIDKNPNDELVPVGLPALSSTSLPTFDKVLRKEENDGQVKYKPRRKTYLPRINPHTKPSLVKKRNAETSEIKFNPDDMSYSKP